MSINENTMKGRHGESGSLSLMPIAVPIPEVAPDTETTSTSLVCQSPKQTWPSTMRMPHEFPWISTVSNSIILSDPPFWRDGQFFSSQQKFHALKLLWGHLFKVRPPFGVVPRGWRNGELETPGREWEKMPRPKSPKVSWVVYLLHFRLV